MILDISDSKEQLIAKGCQNVSTVIEMFDVIHGIADRTGIYHGYVIDIILRSVKIVSGADKVTTPTVMTPQIKGN